MKYFVIMLPLLFIGCSGLPAGYFSPVKTECDDNNVLWIVYKDGHRDFVRDEMGRYTRCEDNQ